MPDYERCPRFNNPNIDCCGRWHKEDRQKISEIEATVDFQNERVVMPRYHLSAVRNAPFYWTTYVRLYSELEILLPPAPSPPAPSLLPALKLRQAGRRGQALEKKE